MQHDLVYDAIAYLPYICLQPNLTKASSGQQAASRIFAIRKNRATACCRLCSRWLTLRVSQRPVEERTLLRNNSLIVMSANNRFETDTLGRAPQPGVIGLTREALRVRPRKQNMQI